MSRSIHITQKNFKGLNQSEINEQANELDSDLNQWNKKSVIKKQSKARRKGKKLSNK